jgi:hypothetical protein
LERWRESPFAPRGDENLRLIVVRGTEEIVDPSHGFVSGFRFRHDPKLKSLPPFRLTENVSQAFLKHVSCPVALLLATDRDLFWPADLEDRHIELLRAKVFRMSGGHHLHMTNVKESLSAIRSLYEEAGFLKLKSKL